MNEDQQQHRKALIKALSVGDLIKATKALKALNESMVAANYLIDHLGRKRKYVKVVNVDYFQWKLQKRAVR